MIKRLSSSIVYSSVLFLAASCGGGETPGPAPGGTSTAAVPPPAAGACISATAADGSLLLQAVDANNYTLVNVMELIDVAMAPGGQWTLDWSALTVDFFKHPIGPGDITNITVGFIDKPFAAVKSMIERDALGGEISAGLTFPIDGTRTSITVPEMYLPYVGMQNPTAADIDGFFNPPDPSGYSYLVTVNEGTVLKKNVKMIQYVHIDPASTTNSVSVTNDSSKLTATATIASKPAISIPASNANITANWDAMVSNAIAEQFYDGSITDVRVLHFPFTAAELEQKVLDLEQLFDQEYKGPPTGLEEAKLATLTNSAGQPFPGIDPAAGGTWVLALMCDLAACGSPAPWFMARLEACQ